MLLNLIIHSFLISAASSCAPGYSTGYDGWCFGWKDAHPYYFTETTSKAICAADAATRPIVRDARENALLAKIAKTNVVFLGLSCDPTTKQYVWDDGTVANYTNSLPSVCPTTPPGYFYMKADGSWAHYPTNNIGLSYYQLCMAPRVSESICDDFELLEINRTRSCFRMFNPGSTWTSAEAACAAEEAHLTTVHSAAENDYIRRTAISKGFASGVYIGLRFVNGSYVWANGETLSYNNFAPSFPDETFGECVALQTSFTAGYWMNIKCDDKSAGAVAACSRNPYMPSDYQPAGCPTATEYRNGSMIYSPSYPFSPGSGYCEYVLLASKGERIKLETQFFETNSCCDNLFVYDGLFGTAVAYTFTGYLRAATYTSTQPAVRLVWNATSGEDIRGFKIAMTAV